MSVLIIPVTVKCSRCKTPVVISELETTTPDPTREQLQALLKMLEKSALCPKCQAGLNFYARMGRGADWQAGRP